VPPAYVSLEALQPLRSHAALRRCVAGGRHSSRGVRRRRSESARETVPAAKRLKEAGVTVQSGLLEQEAEALNAGFMMRNASRQAIHEAQVRGQPGWTHRARQRRQPSGSPAKRRAPTCSTGRALSGATLTSASTVIADNPRLDVRIEAPAPALCAWCSIAAVAVRKNARILTSPGEVLVFAAATALAPARAPAMNAWVAPRSNAYAW